MAPELPQRQLAHSGAVLTWARVGGTELRVGAPAPARGERCQARPEPFARGRRLRVRAHISTEDRLHAKGESSRGANTVRLRVHVVCGGAESRKTRGSRRQARRSCTRSRFECNTMVVPRPPDPASSDAAWCILDRHGPPAPPGARRRDRRTPHQPRFGPESPRRRSDAEAARSVGETRPPGPPTGSFRPGLLRAGGPALAARRPTARRR